MAYRRAIHFVFKITKRDEAIGFYKNVLGMKVVINLSWSSQNWDQDKCKTKTLGDFTFWIGNGCVPGTARHALRAGLPLHHATTRHPSRQLSCLESPPLQQLLCAAILYEQSISDRLPEIHFRIILYP